MLNTAERTEREKALNVADHANVQSQTQVAQVYIPEWAGVKLDGKTVVIAFVKDVEEALNAFRDWKGKDAIILLKYTDGSHVVTAADCKREKFVGSWVEQPHPRHDPEAFYNAVHGAGG